MRSSIFLAVCVCLVASQPTPPIGSSVLTSHSDQPLPPNLAFYTRMSFYTCKDRKASVVVDAPSSSTSSDASMLTSPFDDEPSFCVTGDQVDNIVIPWIPLPIHQKRAFDLSFPLAGFTPREAPYPLKLWVVSGDGKPMIATETLLRVLPWHEAKALARQDRYKGGVYAQGDALVEWQQSDDVVDDQSPGQEDAGEEQHSGRQEPGQKQAAHAPELENHGHTSAQSKLRPEDANAAAKTRTKLASQKGQKYQQSAKGQKGQGEEEATAADIAPRPGPLLMKGPKDHDGSLPMGWWRKVLPATIHETTWDHMQKSWEANNLTHYIENIKLSGFNVIHPKPGNGNESVPFNATLSYQLTECAGHHKVYVLFEVDFQSEGTSFKKYFQESHVPEEYKKMMGDTGMTPPSKEGESPEAKPKDSGSKDSDSKDSKSKNESKNSEPNQSGAKESKLRARRSRLRRSLHNTIKTGPGHSHDEDNEDSEDRDWSDKTSEEKLKTLQKVFNDLFEELEATGFDQAVFSQLTREEKIAVVKMVNDFLLQLGLRSDEASRKALIEKLNSISKREKAARQTPDKHPEPPAWSAEAALAAEAASSNASMSPGPKALNPAAEWAAADKDAPKKLPVPAPHAISDAAKERIAWEAADTLRNIIDKALAAAASKGEKTDPVKAKIAAQAIQSLKLVIDSYFAAKGGKGEDILLRHLKAESRGLPSRNHVGTGEDLVKGFKASPDIYLTAPNDSERLPKCGGWFKEQGNTEDPWPCRLAEHDKTDIVVKFRRNLDSILHPMGEQSRADQTNQRTQPEALPNNDIDSDSWEHAVMDRVHRDILTAFERKVSSSVDQWFQLPVSATNHGMHRRRAQRHAEAIPPPPPRKNRFQEPVTRESQKSSVTFHGSERSDAWDHRVLDDMHKDVLGAFEERAKGGLWRQNQKDVRFLPKDSKMKRARVLRTRNLKKVLQYFDACSRDPTCNVDMEDFLQED